MNVGQLVERLKSVNPNLPVMTRGYEWGYGRPKDEAFVVENVKAEDEAPIQAFIINSHFVEEDEESYGGRYDTTV